MIIVALTDLHGDTHRLSEIGADLAAADVLLLTGDLTHFGSREEASSVVDTVRNYNQNILAVPGNCDYSGVDQFLTEEGINLHGRRVTIENIVFLGLGGSLPCPESTPNEMSEDQLDSCLWQAAESLDPNLPMILVSHQPPLRTKCDRLDDGRHVGSKLVKAFIFETNPLVCFTGHIHEGRAIDTVGTTKVVNPGPFSFGGYAMARVTKKGLEMLELRGSQT